MHVVQMAYLLSPLPDHNPRWMTVQTCYRYLLILLMHNIKCISTAIGCIVLKNKTKKKQNKTKQNKTQNKTNTPHKAGTLQYKKQLRYGVSKVQWSPH